MLAEMVSHFLVIIIYILDLTLTYMPPPPSDFDYEAALADPEDFESFVVGTSAVQGK